MQDSKITPLLYYGLVRAAIYDSKEFKEVCDWWNDKRRWNGGIQIETYRRQLIREDMFSADDASILADSFKEGGHTEGWPEKLKELFG
jgi:hypothetical protein